MSIRSRNRRRLVAGGLAFVLLVGPSAQVFAETSADRRLEALEKALRDTQARVKELEHQLDQQKVESQETQKKVSEASINANTAKADAKKATSLPDWLGKTTVFGDVRYRQEGLYHQPHQDGVKTTARNRQRISAHLGVKVALTDEISATIRGASGNINDPISSNETLTGNFNRKNFNLDWAYLTVTPGQTFGLRPGAVAVTGGKFPNPIFRPDELFLDNDIAAEGVSETFQLLAQPWGALDQVKLHALQWTFAEIANEQDGWMFGGQVNPIFHLGNVQFEGGLGQFWWLNEDLIAQALSRNTTAYTASGAPVANSSFNSSLVNTNLLVTKNIQPPSTRPGVKPARFTAITGYQSGFNQTNVALNATIPGVLLNKSLRWWGDYVYNWDAETDDANGWQTGLRLGQTKVRGDWSLYGFYERLEQEALISAFTWSDYGNSGSNQEGPGIGVDYQLLNPLTLSARSYFTNYINRPAGSSNPTMTRFQFDALVKF